MYLSDFGTGNFEICPPGTYIAECRRLLDIGTVETSFDGKTIAARKVQISWEILDSETRKSDGQPFVIGRRLTMSLHEKSALRPLLVAWRGVEFTADELKRFDLKSVLGKKCMLTVVHQTRGDRSYANIQAVSRPPRGMNGDVAATEPLLYLSLADEQPDWSVFDNLHAKLIDQICQSPEFLAHPNKPAWFKGGNVPSKPPVSAPSRPAVRTPPAPAKPAPAPAVGSGFDDMDDDIPF